MKCHPTCVGSGFIPDRLWAIEEWNDGFRKEDHCMFKGKKAIILGERDGVPGPAIAACLEAAGAQIIFAVTECFV
jgi:glycine reductase